MSVASRKVLLFISFHGVQPNYKCLIKKQITNELSRMCADRDIFLNKVCLLPQEPIAKPIQHVGIFFMPNRRAKYELIVGLWWLQLVARDY